MRGKILFYFLLVLVLLYLPRTPSEPERAFLVVVDTKGNAVTDHVGLSLQGLAAYGAIASAAVLASVALAAGVNAVKRAVEWVLVVGLVLASTVLSGNPLLIVVAGIGLGIFALTIWLYPGEFGLVYRTAAATMLFWGLTTIVFAFIARMVTAIASMLTYTPDLGFLNAVYINATMVANFIILLPVIASLYTLMRLYMTSRRARDVKEALTRLRE